jgi:hypothetical protein
VRKIFPGGRFFTDPIQPDEIGGAGDILASGNARWLGVQPDGRAEQLGILLFDPPYALKAADAETLGGFRSRPLCHPEPRIPCRKSGPDVSRAGRDLYPR